MCAHTTSALSKETVTLQKLPACQAKGDFSKYPSDTHTHTPTKTGDWGVVRHGKGALQNPTVTATGIFLQKKWLQISPKEFYSSVNPGRVCNCCSCNTHRRNSQRQLWACFSISMFAFGLLVLKIGMFRVDFLQHVYLWSQQLEGSVWPDRKVVWAGQSEITV